MLFKLNTSGKVVERGCTLDVFDKGEDWCMEEDGCNTCTGDYCNNANAHFSSCVQCGSDIKGNCAVLSNFENNVGKCERSPYPFSKRGCYISVESMLKI